ncbi:MAG: MBL fold metallo-hydrolase [Clostridia bacterium]|nr:MBL fold metallo-hydrolase [Clostridia bacterium]
MKIEYLGHSCFLLTSDGGTSVLTDPYGYIGYSLPRVTATAVTVSHGHYDHNNVADVSGFPQVLDKAEAYAVKDVSVRGIFSFHDEKAGALRGGNIIFKYKIDGINVCHLGDLGEPCTAELIQKILPVDVLFIPVGGRYTIDGKQAIEYVKSINPAVVIPMHYHTKGLRVDVAGAEAFLSGFTPNQIEYAGSCVTIDRETVNRNSTKVIKMERSEER